MKLRRAHFVYMATLLSSALFLVIGNAVGTGGARILGQEMSGEMVRARVLEIRKEEKETPQTFSDGTQAGKTTIYFKAKVAAGSYKGRTLNCIQEIDGAFALQIPKVRAGDSVLLDIAQIPEEGMPRAYLYEYVRTGPLLVLAGLFAGLVIVFGRKKGVDTVLSLVITVFAVFLVLVPATLSGRNIYFWSMLVCVFIVLSNLLLVQGPGLKSLTAALGCVGGIISAWLVCQLVKAPMHITGLVEEEDIYVLQLNPQNPIDLRAAVFAMILVGCVGALMDVSMSIASALQEVLDTDKGASRGKLLKSGFEIGKDMIGTMANTLVLAYIGGAMSSILLLIRYSANVTMILNKEMVAVEILSALSGSLSVVVAILVTSVICSLLYVPSEKRQKRRAQDRQSPAG